MRHVPLACAAAMFMGVISARAELMTEEGIGQFNVVYVLGDQKIALADPWWATLYTYAKDGNGVSNCTGPCTDAWPPLLANATDIHFEAFVIVERPDGKRQWAHRGRPLYTSVLDKAKGDANGQGIDDAWFLVEIEAHDM